LASTAAPNNWKQLSLGGLIAMLKPQVFAAGLFISFLKSQKRLYVIAAAILAAIVTVIIWGIWFREVEPIDSEVSWNRAFPVFPLGWIIGIPIFLWGIYRRDETFGLIAMPFLAPYFAPHSFLPMLVYLCIQLPISRVWVAWSILSIWVIVTV
jgi:hypothetical protein